LSAFKQLNSVTYVAASSPESIADNDDDQKIAEMWYTHCPTLKTIILPRGTVWCNKEGKWGLP
jgi:hypothetical protein